MTVNNSEPPAEVVAKETEQKVAEVDVKETVKDTTNGDSKTEAVEPTTENVDEATKPADEKPAPTASETPSIEQATKNGETDGDAAKPVPVAELTDPAAKSAAEAIANDLGADAKLHYQVAYPLVTKTPNLENLESATERLVTALQAAPEEKSTTRGYGELALLYGRALLGFVVRGATEGDVLGGKAKAGDEEEENVEKDGDDEIGKEKEEEKDKEDTTEELCWTQLEVARLAFQKSGPSEKLCEAVRTIGEFLLACDQASAAGEEFGTAAGMCSGRGKAECLYKRYLSLRRVSIEEARVSLKEAVAVMKEIEGTEDVVKEMNGELEALPGGTDNGKGVKRAAEVTVTRVTPKRKK